MKHMEPIGAGYAPPAGSKRGPCNGGGGGGGSSSSNSTSTTTQNTDKRQVVDNNSIGVSSDSSTVNVNVLDNDAINKALDFSRDGGASLVKSFSEVVGLAKDVIALNKGQQELVARVADGSIDDVKAAYTTAQDGVSGVRVLVIGGALIAGLVALKGKA